MANKVYILMIVLLVLMVLGLTSLNKIKAPLKELAQLPRCDINDVVLTKDFLTSVRDYASGYIREGTGSDYFSNHYQYLDTTYSTIDCTFVVKYSFTYEEAHQTMSITVHALNATNLDVTQINAFLRPVSVLINNTQAEGIAKNQNISYDYYNKEIIIPEQTIVYRFYKETFAQGTILVLEVDAQSKQIIKIERPKELVPIV